MLHPSISLRLALPLLLVWLLCANMTVDPVAWQNNSGLESGENLFSAGGDGNGESAPSLTHPIAVGTPALPVARPHRAWRLLQPGHGGPAARAPPHPLHV